eukprot:1744464-Rhodomonas_salina.2
MEANTTISSAYYHLDVQALNVCFCWCKSGDKLQCLVHVSLYNSPLALILVQSRFKTQHSDTSFKLLKISPCFVQNPCVSAKKTTMVPLTTRAFTIACILSSTILLHSGCIAGADSKDSLHPVWMLHSHYPCSRGNLRVRKKEGYYQTTHSLIQFKLKPSWSGLEELHSLHCSAPAALRLRQAERPGAGPAWACPWPGPRPLNQSCRLRVSGRLRVTASGTVTFSGSGVMCNVELKGTPAPHATWASLSLGLLGSLVINWQTQTRILSLTRRSHIMIIDSCWPWHWHRVPAAQ